MLIRSRYGVREKGRVRMEMVEAAGWLLRNCGQHERAIDVLQERIENPAVRNKIVGVGLVAGRVVMIGTTFRYQDPSHF